MKAPLYAAALLLCFAGIFASPRSKLPSVCSQAPELKFKGLNPIEEASKDGKITVVALLDAKCGYCIGQASLLQILKDKLDNKNLTNITYIIINRKSARGMAHVFGKGHGIQVYESEMDVDTWKKLKGMKDDFFIYDRCGLLAYYIEHPSSFLGAPIVRNAILFAYEHKHPCKKQCPKGKASNKDASKSM